MAEPGDGGVMRVSDADRERAIDRLKAAFADGMLARDEFETRVGLALTSWTRADLQAVTADIPDQATQTPPPAERPQPQPPKQRSPSVKKAFVVGGATLLAGFMAAADFGGGSQLAILLIFCLLVTGIASALVAGIVKTILIVEARQARRGSGSLPPSPGTQPARRRPGTRPDGQSSGPDSLAIGLR